jgi:hypothetical protein
VLFSVAGRFAKVLAVRGVSTHHVLMVLLSLPLSLGFDAFGGGEFPVRHVMSLAAGWIVNHSLIGVFRAAPGQNAVPAQPSADV